MDKKPTTTTHTVNPISNFMGGNKASIKTAIIFVSIVVALAIIALGISLIYSVVKIDYQATDDLVTAVSKRWDKLKESAGVTESPIIDYTGDKARINRLTSDYVQAVTFLGESSGIKDKDIKDKYESFKLVSDIAIRLMKQDGSLDKNKAKEVDNALKELTKISYKKTFNKDLQDVCDEECKQAIRRRDELRVASVVRLLSEIRSYSLENNNEIPDASQILDFVNERIVAVDGAFSDPSSDTPYSFIGWSNNNRLDPEIGTIQYGGAGTLCNGDSIVANINSSTSVAIRTVLENGSFYCRDVK
jgi:hypothetical protein